MWGMLICVVSTKRSLAVKVAQNIVRSTRLTLPKSAMRVNVTVRHCITNKAAVSIPVRIDSWMVSFMMRWYGGNGAKHEIGHPNE